eukprot:13127.XXX_124784_123722_1 [CDS] Oithona nana genome sequencing.
MAEDGAIDAESHLIKAEAFDMDKVPCTEIIEEIDTSDEEDDPDVEEIQDKNITSDNHTTCLKDDLTALKEVFDDEVCTSMIIGWYDACKDVKLDPDSTSSFISGCEFDYSANTYRLQVTTSSGSVTIGENFVIVKVDGATGMPKVLSVG